MTIELDSDITVRPAKAADAGSIASLCGQLGYPSTSDDIEHRLAEATGDPDATVLVADSRSDGVIGWVHVRTLRLITRDACAEIGGLVSMRRGAAGTRLMAAAEEWARNRGLSALRLRSNVIRNAHVFYRGRGLRTQASLLFTKALATYVTPGKQFDRSFALSASGVA
jgi:GNAT superfamily N-acetyltransferase